MKTAILGGGISGLTLARRLREAGLESVVFEAAPKVGGLCGSETVEGFTYDVAGGHILYSKEKAVLDWMAENTDGGCAQRARSTKIRIGDRFIHYPFENGIGDLDKKQTFDCLIGYLRAADARKSGAAAPRNFGDWIHYRFGEGIERIFMKPYNEKIWKRALETLSTEWVEGRVPDAPVEDVVRAAIGIRTEGYTHQSIFYYPLNGGFEAIPRGIARPIRDAIRLNTPVREIRRVGDQYRVNGEFFDRVVNTIPLPDFIKFTPDLDPAARDAVLKLQFNSLTSVAVGLNHDKTPEYSWIYLPHPEQGPANRITYLNNYSPNVAPPGKSLILAEATCVGVPRKDPEFVDEIVDGLAHAGLMNKSDVVMKHASTVKYAYVIFDHDFRKKIDAALRGVEALGIESLGRFGRFEYINSDQCVSRAFALADRLVEESKSGRRLV
ncbi:MAG: FAD-dependent oxidoreductase [Planctomycetes bacterium]|nr:FAD-dependent oxidoreductase [Planctomycetota bacterium]